MVVFICLSMVSFFSHLSLTFSHIYSNFLALSSSISLKYKYTLTHVHKYTLSLYLSHTFLLSHRHTEKAAAHSSTGLFAVRECDLCKQTEEQEITAFVRLFVCYYSHRFCVVVFLRCFIPVNYFTTYFAIV